MGLLSELLELITLITPFVTSNDPWGVILRVSELASLMNIYIHSYDKSDKPNNPDNPTYIVWDYCLPLGVDADLGEV